MKVEIKLSKEFAKVWEAQDYSFPAYDHVNRILNGFGSILEKVDGKKRSYKLLMPEGYETAAWNSGLKRNIEDMKDNLGLIKKIKIEP